MKVFLLLLSVVCVCHGENATLVLLTEAVEEGAVCLDGSPPGYYIRPGNGNGTDKWILHLGGGGGCRNESACYEQSKTALGSSKDWLPYMTLSGFLSDNSTVNPDFYYWNIIRVMYCDGGSFAGNVINTVYYNDTAVYFRGQAILQATLDNLMEKGMANASEVILSGSSAGGTSVFQHADYVKAYLPQKIRFCAIADAGYFLDLPNIYGDNITQEDVKYVFKMQNASGGVNQDCLQAYSEDEAWKCFFAPNTYPYIQTPMFVVNSQYDTSQLAHILALGCLPPNCTEEQMEFFDQFREDFLQQAEPVIESTTSGVFLDSCLTHTQMIHDDLWSTHSIMGQTIQETLSVWYFNRTDGNTKMVDCAYPCNPSCEQEEGSTTCFYLEN